MLRGGVEVRVVGWLGWSIRFIRRARAKVWNVGGVVA